MTDDDTRTVGDLSRRRVWVTSTTSRGRQSPVHLSTDCRAFALAATPMEKEPVQLDADRPVCRYCDGTARSHEPKSMESYRTLADANPSDFP